MIEVHPEIKNLVAAGRLAAQFAPKVSALAPGTFVLSKTFGAGQVKEWDLLGDRLVVDFEKKQDHAIRLEFATKMMDPVEPNNFYARRFANKDALLKEAIEAPADFMKNLLESHGGRLAIELFEDAIRGPVVPPAKYKSWWDSTKKALRGNAQFIIPSKRNVPLELRAGGISATDAREQDVRESRDLKSKTKAVEAMVKDHSLFAESPERLAALAAHIEESAQQNLRLKTTESIDLLLLRDDLVDRVPALAEGVKLTLKDALEQISDRVPDFIGGLSATKQNRIFTTLANSVGAEAWLDGALITLVNRLNARSITEVVKVSTANNVMDKLANWMKANIASRNLSSEALAWVCRERQGLGKGIFTSEIAGALMSAVERDHFDEDKKTNRVMDELVEDPELIKDLVANTPPNLINNFARQIMLSSAFEELSKRSVLARLIKLAPDVQDLVDEHGEDQTGPTETLIVSWSSLEAKKEALDQLVNVEIPKNREEISIARSYGDLRENSEYKFAKEHQKVLQRRQMEFERDLNRAKGSDFSEYHAETVGIGTVVTIRDLVADTEDTYTILGAWDSKPAEHILSYLTEIAKALAGQEVGGIATVPSEGEAGTREVQIKSITKWKGSI